MNDTVPKNDEMKKGSINDAALTGNNKGTDNEEKINDQEFILNTNNTDYRTIGEKVFNKGEIIVTSILECGENEYLKGVKINLYKINGLSPVLIKSEITDEKGTVVFSEIEEGCYRIIEIIDKRYFEKPKYINWNEIIIDKTNKSQKIIIVNKIKRNVSTNKHKS